MTEKYGLRHISTGALLRKEIAAGTELGRKAHDLNEAGCLVPDEMVEAMIEAEFCNNEGISGFLLDGFPRTLAQAEVLDRMLEKRGERVTSVVSLMIPDEMIFERIRHRAMIEGREDDAKDETIATRIATYHKKTEPLVSFYKESGRYKEVDGRGTIEDVRAKVFELLDNIG